MVCIIVVSQSGSPLSTLTGSDDDDSGNSCTMTRPPACISHAREFERKRDETKRKDRLWIKARADACVWVRVRGCRTHNMDEESFLPFFPSLLPLPTLSLSLSHSPSLYLERFPKDLSPQRYSITTLAAV